MTAFNAVCADPSCRREKQGNVYRTNRKLITVAVDHCIMTGHILVGNGCKNWTSRNADVAGQR
jgi:hypothetical protein